MRPVNGGPYRIEAAPSARRDMKRLVGPVRRRVADAIDALAETPRPAGVKKLAGRGDLYRVRVGDYRIVYRIEDDRLVVLVIRVGHRRDVYRRGE